MTGFGFRRMFAGSGALSALLIVCLNASTVHGANPDLPKADEGWIEVRTTNFRIFSNAGNASTRQVAEDLEELRAALAQLTDLELHSPVPTFIYLFRNDRAFSPFKILYAGQPGVMSGYFIDGAAANYIAIDAGSQDATAIVYHEYVHYVMANNFWWLPVWLSEGLAEFYQTFDVVDDTVYLGLPIASHLDRLRGSIPIPLADLLVVDHQSPLYNEEDRKSDYYAECWALTHCLLLGNDERREQFERYLTIIGLGVPAETAFTDAFGPDLQALEREVRAHLRGQRIPFLKSRTEFDVDQTLTIRDMDPAEVLYRLGSLLGSQRPVRPETVDFFEAALAVDPDHSPSLTALALAAEEDGDFDAAASFYARAVRANPDDPVALFNWGRFLSGQRSESGRAVAALQRATTLQPSFAPAWKALSHLYVQLGDTSDEAVAAAETAHRLQPADESATRSLLRLYLKLDRRDEAAALIEDSLASSPRARREAWMALLHNDILQARKLLQEDRPSQASIRLAAAERDVDRSARPLVIESGIEDVRTSIAEHEGARIYDRAFARYEDGDKVAARGLLEQALAALPEEGPVTASCRRLLDVIDNPENYAIPEIPPVSPTREEIDQLNRLLAAGEISRARDFLVAIRERSSGPQEQWIDGKIRELQLTLDYNHSVEVYNAAVDFYNRQEYDTVVAMLDEYLAINPDGPQSASVRSLRNDAQRRIENRSHGQP